MQSQLFLGVLGCPALCVSSSAILTMWAQSFRFDGSVVKAFPRKLFAGRICPRCCLCSRSKGSPVSCQETYGFTVCSLHCVNSVSQVIFACFHTMWSFAHARLWAMSSVSLSIPNTCVHVFMKPSSVESSATIRLMLVMS